jgi:uncharacterized protein (DUF362 family)
MNRILRDEGVVWSGEFVSYRQSLPPVLEASGLADELAGRQTVVIKPNLVEALEPPITTHVDMVEALVDFILLHNSEIRIIVGEGTGALEYDTFHCFDQLGYMKLQNKDRVQLLDLNIEPCRRLTNDACKRWPELYLPELAHYQQGGAWGKSSFHSRLDEAIFDLNRYRTPEFTVTDAAVGMAKAHLWGPTCSPPVKKVFASYDPVAADAYGTSLLSKSWKDIGHIWMANGVLGQAEPLDVREPAVA